MYGCAMSPKVRFNMLLDEHQRQGLRAVKERDGIPESEQVRRAIDEWLERRGITSERKRAVTRKRSSIRRNR